MSKLDLTTEERDYVERIARERHGMKDRLAFYAAIGGPTVAFGIYGFIKRDFVAEFVAFGGLLLFLLWWISQEARYVGMHTSLFRKIAEHERRREDDA